MTPEQDELLEQIDTLRQDIVSRQARLDQVRVDLAQAVAAAVDAGVSQAEVARVAGVSRQRVNAMVRDADTVAAQVHAQKQGPGPVRVNDPATVPTIPATPNGLTAGVRSMRDRRPYGKQTTFVDTRTYPRLADVLDRALWWGGGRIYLVGPAPFDPASGATQAEQVRAWVMSELPEGWSHGAHYLADPVLPVCRYVHEARGLRVTIMRAAMWWGETDADTSTCIEAWRRLGELVDRTPAFAGAGIADTPATTGRTLWLRTIPEGKGYDVLAPELRQLIAETAGQGRIELRAQPRRPSECERVCRDFTYLDGRFMYAALTWGMPVGEPVMWTGQEVDTALSDAERERVFRGRGRWRITATVPDGWEHVGLLMAPDPSGGWCYPYVSGQTFTTWADGSEVWQALGHGWPVRVHEGMTWAEGRPLNMWRDALVKLWTGADQAGRNGHADAVLVARAIRSIVLHAIGAFATRAHPVTRSAPADSNPEVPAGSEVRIVGDQLVWQEPAPQSAWVERVAHPEWSATIWARARTRLTTAALKLDPARVVGFATDALYVAGGDPGWDDDGKPGTFRSKGTRPGAFTWPETYNQLYQLRDEAEEA